MLLGATNDVGPRLVAARDSDEGDAFEDTKTVGEHSSSAASLFVLLPSNPATTYSVIAFRPRLHLSTTPTLQTETHHPQTPSSTFSTVAPGECDDRCIVSLLLSAHPQNVVDASLA